MTEIKPILPAYYASDRKARQAAIERAKIIRSGYPDGHCQRPAINRYIDSLELSLAKLPPEPPAK